MRGPWIQGARREEPAGVLDSTLRTPTERNAEDAGLSRAVAGRWWEMQARSANIALRWRRPLQGPVLVRLQSAHSPPANISIFPLTSV